jgi:hypothetical protein
MNSSLPQSIIQQAWMSQPESEASVSCLLGIERIIITALRSLLLCRDQHIS